MAVTRAHKSPRLEFSWAPSSAREPRRRARGFGGDNFALCGRRGGQRGEGGLSGGATVAHGAGARVKPRAASQIAWQAPHGRPDDEIRPASYGGTARPGCAERQERATTRRRMREGEVDQTEGRATAPVASVKRRGGASVWLSAKIETMAGEGKHDVEASAPEEKWNKKEAEKLAQADGRFVRR